MCKLAAGGCCGLRQGSARPNAFKMGCACMREAGVCTYLNREQQETLGVPGEQQEQQQQRRPRLRSGEVGSIIRLVY